MIEGLARTAVTRAGRIEQETVAKRCVGIQLFESKTRLHCKCFPHRYACIYTPAISWRFRAMQLYDVEPVTPHGIQHFGFSRINKYAHFPHAVYLTYKLL